MLLKCGYVSGSGQPYYLKDAFLLICKFRGSGRADAEPTRALSSQTPSRPEPCPAGHRAGPIPCHLDKLTYFLLFYLFFDVFFPVLA